MAYKTKEIQLTSNLFVPTPYMNIGGAYCLVGANVPVAPLSTYGAVTSFVGTGSTGVIGVPGDNQSIYLTNILVTNSNASLGTRVDIRGGDQTIYTGYAVPEGGWAQQFPCAIKVGNNVGLNAICATASAGVYISAAGFIGEF